MLKQLFSSRVTEIKSAVIFNVYQTINSPML